MAYKQNAGRGNSPKTGNGIPSALMQIDPKKPNFKGSVDKGEMGGGYLPGATANTDLLEVGKYYGGKAIDAVKGAATKALQFASDFAEGKKGSSSYSGGDESMRQKNIAKNKAKK